MYLLFFTEVDENDTGLLPNGLTFLTCALTQHLQLLFTTILSVILKEEH